MEVGGQDHVLAVLPTGKRLGTHFIAGWVGPRAGVDGRGKFRFHRVSKALAVQTVASRFID